MLVVFDVVCLACIARLLFAFNTSRPSHVLMLASVPHAYISSFRMNDILLYIYNWTHPLCFLFNIMLYISSLFASIAGRSS